MCRMLQNHKAVDERSAYNFVLDGGQQAVPKQVHYAHDLAPEYDWHVEQELRDDQERYVLGVTKRARMQVGVHREVTSNAAQEAGSCNGGKRVDAAGKPSAEERDAARAKQSEGCGQRDDQVR